MSRFFYEKKATVTDEDEKSVKILHIARGDSREHATLLASSIPSIYPDHRYSEEARARQSCASTVVVLSLPYVFTGARLPPVILTRCIRLPQRQPGCRTTHAKNLCPLGSSAVGFSTRSVVQAFHLSCALILSCFDLLTITGARWCAVLALPSVAGCMESYRLFCYTVSSFPRRTVIATRTTTERWGHGIGQTGRVLFRSIYSGL